VLDNLSMGIKQGRAAAKRSATTWTFERIYEHFSFMRERTAQKGRLLSGGEQQMLAIARTLMGNPDLVLVDEPTEGLAPLVVKEVRDVLAEVNRAGVSILLVEHNLKVAMSLAHRVYLMGKAHVGFSGTVEDLNAQPEIRARYLEV
jgi:branched-chain amino acid transport system ATP-binding protein